MSGTINFKAGDIVKLKSGGPEMTIKSFAPTKQITCQWFAGKKLEVGMFVPESLEQIPPVSK